MAKTKFFRIATSGATTDGRTIKDQDLIDMAATYDPATYGARVNLEHYMAAHPDSAFAAYGDVLALKTEPVTLNVGGKPEQRLGLYAEVDALDPLMALKDKKQKIFTSIEVTPNFAGSGKAYLTGLAFTDNPASLGTEMMKFCADMVAKGAGEASPLHFRKSREGALFTAAEETTFELSAGTTPVGAPGRDPGPSENSIMDALIRALRGFTGGSAPAAPEAPAASEPATPAPEIAAGFTAVREAIDAFGKISAAHTAQLASFTADLATLRTDLAAAQGETAALKAALGNTAPAGFTARRPATGADAEKAFQTDC